MATLTNQNLDKEHGAVCFTLVPVSPTLQGPVHAYKVAFQEGATLVERCYHVDDWELGHRVMLRIGSAFIQAAAFTPQYLPVRRLTVSGIPELHQSVSIFVDHYWLQICLEPRAYRRERYISAHMWLETQWLERTEDTPGFPECVHCVMQVSLEHAKRFGEELIAECLEAARARIELGLGVRDDYDYLGIQVLDEEIR